MRLKDIDRDMGSDYPLRKHLLISLWFIFVIMILSYVPQVLGSLFLADPMKSAISPPLRAIFGM